MIDHFGPEDIRWRYPQLETEYEPDEGRGPCRSLNRASQGHAMARGCCASTPGKAGLCLSACVRSHTKVVLW